MTELDTNTISPECISAISRGDRGALGELYDACSPMLYGLALKILGNSAEADDVLQETFLYIWKRACTYEPSLSCPSFWATMILRGKAIDHLRSRKRRANLLERATVERFANTTVAAGPADRPVLFDQEQQLRVALESLPYLQQQAIRLAFFDGLTHEEIAAKLRIPVGTIKSRIRRGIMELRGTVTHDCPDPSVDATPG